MKALIKKLNSKGISLFVKQRELKVKAPKGVITESIRLEIKGNLAALVDYLSVDSEYHYQDIPIIPNQESYSLSSAQRRIWILSQFEGGNPAYNMPRAYEFEGDLDISSFYRAFDNLIARHEILRTIFKKDESGEVRQWVKATGEQRFEIDYRDLRKIENQELRVKELVQTESEKVFDLEQGPLLSAQLLQTAKDKYTFSYVMHHIISDGWSMGVMIKELMTLYNNYSQGKDSPLEALSLQYKDYSAWQLRQLEDGNNQQHKNYWLNQLSGGSGKLPVLELPTDYLRPALKTYNGNIIKTVFSKEKIQKLKVITQAEGSTLYMGLLSLVKTLIYRYTNQEDIMVGTPIAGREHEGLSDQIGFYINTLVLRNQINGEESFREFLKRVKQTALDAYEHQAYPFDVLIEDLQLEKDLSRSPLFDIWVVLQNIEFESNENLNLGDLRVSIYEETEQNTSQFDLSFIFSESEEGLNLALQYNTDLFERETIERFQNHLDQLLSAIVKNPDQALKAIPYLSKKEEEQLLVDFNDTNVDYPKDKTIVHLFEEQVAKTPNNIALAFKEKEFTYQELDVLSNQLAHCLLSEYKIKPEEIIGIQLEKSPWFIISILGILKSGGAYLPIDTEYPASRKEFLLKDSNTQLLITSTNYIFDLDFYDGNVFSIDVEFEANKYPAESVKTKQSGSSLAYVMYTSGSTGQPKGVQIEHQSIVRLVHRANYITFKETDVLLSTGSPSFDASTFEYWGMLLNGGTLILSEAALFTDANLLLKEIEQRAVNMMWFTSGLLNQLVDTDITVFSRLETIIAGGDKLSLSHIQKLKEAYPEINIINGYGPTENTTFSLTYRIPTKEITQIPIGKPITNTNVYVLDDTESILPIGVIGEICIGGSGLARGYLNRPELTAEKFVSNPFKEGERMYKTGDLGRWLADGNIEFVGRKDEQVKVKGYRIELGEIENVLQQHPAIGQTVVLVKEDASQEKQLVAYLTSKEELTTSGLISYLKKMLPAFMIPSHFVPLAVFPLTSNGKVNKKALPNPEGLVLASGVAYVAPSNKIEKELVKIWSEVLKVEEKKIGVKDDFFTLGGDSMIAIRLLGKINQNSQSQLSIAQLYATPTIEGIYDFITNDSSTIDNYSTTLEEIEKEITDLKKEVLSTRADAGEIEDIYPMLDMQKGMCMTSLLYEGEGVYYDQLVYQVEKIELSHFQKAIELLVEKHAILRSRFNLGIYSQDIQIVYKNLSFEICYEDLSNLAGEKQKEQIAFYLEKERISGFEINGGDLWKIDVFDLSEKSSVYIFQIHHAITDGWSVASFNVELFQVYKSLIEGSIEQPSLLQTTYRDAVVEEIYEKHNETSIDYWKKELEDYKRLAIFSKESCSREYKQHYDADFLKKLETKGKQDNISIKTIFLGSFLFALNILSQEGDTTIGLVTNKRPLKEDGDRVLGCFVNSIPFRVDLDKQKEYTTTNYLKEVERKLIQLKARDRLSLFEISKITNEPTSNANPFFDVLFNYVNFHKYQDIKDENVLVGEKRNIEIESFERTNTYFDLSVNTTHGDIIFSYKLHKALKSQFTLEKFHLLVEKILEEYINDTSLKLKAIPYLSKKEEEQLLVDFNDTNVNYPKDKTIVHLFEEQVAKTPNNIALAFKEKEFTYQELDVLSNQLAHCLLSEYKIKPEEIIGIQLEKSPWYIISILGILKAGGAYLPIDTEYPTSRKEFLLKDSNTQLLITSTNYIFDLDFYDGNIFSIDVEFEENVYSSESVKTKQSNNNLAYVMYTSGSTGQPKGVQIEHQSIVRLVCKPNYITFKETDVLLSTGSPSFDASTFEYWGMLLNGGTLILSEAALFTDANLLLKEIEKKSVNMMWFTSGLLNQLVDTDITVFSRLETIIAGGDKLSLSHIQKLKETYPKTNIINGYGPTENTTFSLTYKIPSKEITQIPIGKPITNTNVYVLGVDSNILPLGVVGEICLSGEGLARGYLNRPELTAEKFVSNPFKEGERMYKTGDLGRWLADGTIEFIGRKDDQVKIRGYRIELGEIENVLQQHPAVEQTVVLVKEDANQEKQLVAYLTSKEELTTSDLRVHLKKVLPDYMLPSHFVPLGVFPLTSNGKVDKKALPNPEGLGLATGVEYVAPSNEIEKELVTIWSEVLKINADKIGVKDDFFDLGGHSLRATTLVSKIYQRLEVTISLKNLFENTTIEKQALFISKEEKTSYYQITKVASQESYALSSAQRRLWILSQFEGGNLAYNIPEVYEFKGDLDIPAFQKSLDTLIERHEILRTVFKKDASGEVRQWIKTAEEQGFKIDYQDLRKVKSQKSKVEAFVQTATEKVFDLEEGPLLRAQLLQTTKDKYIFTYVMHHIISDGWSMGVMIKELLTLYNSYSQGKPSPLEELSIQYKDYSAWQLNQLEDENGQGHKDYWLNQFSGELPILELPIDHIRPALKTYNGSNVSGVFSEHISSQLQQLIKTENSTLFMGLLSLVKSLLYRYTGQEDIIIGSPIAGREHADLADQIGFYVNTLALRTQFGGDDSFSELLQKVKATTLSAYEHQIYPLDELVDHIDLKRDLSRNPLFDVLVVLQNNEITSKEEKLEELQISSFETSDSLYSKFDLSFNFIETDQGLNYSITYNTDLFEKETIKRLENHLNQLLSSIVASPEKSINQLDYLSKSEEQQLLLGFNDTNADCPKDKTIIELFEDQVSKTPNDIAVVFQEKEYTYQELNEQANQLGDYLRSNYKIQSDDLIGIKLDRSEWMIIAILGVLKSGGAYVPIDPEYPEDRINFILSDSSCKVLIDEKELDKLSRTRGKYVKENQPILTKPEDLAYVIYTSGSTGVPKGCMLENKSIINRLDWMWKAYGFSRADIILQKTTFTFDVSVWEILMPLCYGAKMVVCEKEATYSPALLVEIIKKKQVSCLHFVPSMLDAFIYSVFSTPNFKEDLSSLTNIITSGEALNVSTISKWYEGMDIRINNLYGPTEASIDVTYYPTSKEDDFIPIGKPINNTQIYILGKKEALLPIGLVGEICLSGDGLARGYLNRPELTSEKFVSNPFKAGEKMYKTGDLGRWLPNGNIEFLGRKDDQVKIRGYRIELGEIESGLLQHPSIIQTVVLVKEVENQEKQLVAYLTSDDEQTTSDLRSYLKKKLPDYMIPAHFVQLESFPLTPNGKVDKKSLPSPEGLGLSLGVEYVAPSNEIEKELVKIWSEVLKVEEEKIGVKDDFFALGGHSLKAVEVVNKIHKHFDVEFGIETLFLSSNIKLIAESIYFISSSLVEENDEKFTI